jgi:autotransporter-associated beta strand protein
MKTPQINQSLRRSRTLLLATVVTVFCILPRAMAAQLTWGVGGVGGVGAWDTATSNWWTGSVNTNWNNNVPDSAIFGGTGGDVTLGGPITVGDITINTTGYGIGNAVNTLTLSNSTITANANIGISSIVAGTTGLIKAGAGEIILWSPMIYTGETRIDEGGIVLAGSGAISASSTLNLVGGSNTYINLTGAFAATNINRAVAGLTGSGQVAGSGGTFTVNKASGREDFSGRITGGQGFIKSGAGTLALSGSNSYTGGTLISGGMLQMLEGGLVAGNITNNAALNFDGAHSGIGNVISGTGSLVKSGTGTAVLYSPSTYTGATVVNGGQLMLGGSGSISSSSGLQVAAGASVNLTGFFAAADTNRTINGLTGAGILYGGGGTLTVNKASGSDTFGGDIQGGQGLIKSGEGTLVLSATNSYTGGTLILEGTLELAPGGVVSGGITNNARVVVGGDVVNVVRGSGSLTKSGPTEAAIWNPTTYTGATVVQGGRLRLDGAGTISASSALQVDAEATFSTTGFFLTSNNVTVAGLTGAGIVQGAVGTLTISKPTNTSDVFTGKIEGGLGLTLAGATQLWLAGSNNYTERTVVGADNVLNLVNGNGLGNTLTGTTVVSGGVLRLQGTNAGGSGITVGAEALSISGLGRNNSGGALRSVNGTNTWQGKVALAADARIGAASGSFLTLDVASGNAIEATNFNLSTEGAGHIRVNDVLNLGSGSLTKLGTGSLILAASNSYSGGTTVSEGVLVVAQSNFTASITSTSVTVVLGSVPVTGATYQILPGSLAGSYPAPAVSPLSSGQSASFDTTTGILSIIGAESSYDSWATSYGLDLGTDGAPAADPDGDAFNNSSEYAFGTSPVDATAALVGTSTSGGDLTVFWIERDSDLTYVIQSTEDLKLGFTDDPGIIPAISGDQDGVPAGYSRKQFTVTAAGKKFFRIRSVGN